MKITNEKLNFKISNKGITLIALVATIIVLLILAGISIAMLTGENGILTQAKNAKSETENAQVAEENILANYDSYINATTNGNTVYTDNAGLIEIIPKGFYIVPGLDNVKEGLVISDVANDITNKGNQFVWIPVDKPVANSEEEANINKSMAVKSGDNYKGILYDFFETGSKVISGCTTTNKDYREPDIVSSGTDYDGQYYLDPGFNSLEEMKSQLQSEYNRMITSIEKYHGFYIGRYELGLEGTIPASKKAGNGIVTANNSNLETNMWYGLYSKCKEYAKESENKSVVSSMIWGSQYDAVLNWFLKSETKVKLLADDINTIRNTNTETGTEEKDLIKNIYDIYGCHYEWTLEANYNYFRVSRGGFYEEGYSINGRGGYPPTGKVEYYSSRITLYMK